EEAKKLLAKHGRTAQNLLGRLQISPVYSEDLAISAVETALVEAYKEKCLNFKHSQIEPTYIQELRSKIKQLENKSRELKKQIEELDEQANEVHDTCINYLKVAKGIEGI